MLVVLPEVDRHEREFQLGVAFPLRAHRGLHPKRQMAELAIVRVEIVLGRGSQPDACAFAAFPFALGRKSSRCEEIPGSLELVEAPAFTSSLIESDEGAVLETKNIALVSARERSADSVARSPVRALKAVAASGLIWPGTPRIIGWRASLSEQQNE